MNNTVERRANPFWPIAVFFIVIVFATMIVIVPRMLTRTNPPVQAAALVVATGSTPVPSMTPTIYSTPTEDATLSYNLTQSIVELNNQQAALIGEQARHEKLLNDQLENSNQQTKTTGDLQVLQTMDVILAGTPKAQATGTQVALILNQSQQNNAAKLRQQERMNYFWMIVGAAVILLAFFGIMIFYRDRHLKNKQAELTNEALELDNHNMRNAQQAVQDLTAKNYKLQEIINNAPRVPQSEPQEPIKPECLTPEIEAAIAAYVITTGLWNDDMREPKIKGLTRVNLQGGPRGTLAQACHYYIQMGYVRATGNTNKPYEPTRDGLAYWNSRIVAVGV